MTRQVDSTTLPPEEEEEEEGAAVVGAAVVRDRRQGGSTEDYRTKNNASSAFAPRGVVKHSRVSSVSSVEADGRGRHQGRPQAGHSYCGHGSAQAIFQPRPHLNISHGLYLATSLSWPKFPHGHGSSLALAQPWPQLRPSHS